MNMLLDLVSFNILILFDVALETTLLPIVLLQDQIDLFLLFVVYMNQGWRFL